MDFETFRTAVFDFVREHRAWAPLVVAALALGESIAVLSLVVPATVLLIGVGALVDTGGLAFWPLWAGAVIGAVLGDWLSFEFGRYFQDAAKRMWPLNRQPAMIAKGEAYTRRWGAGAVFFGRFLGPLRAVVPLVAGIFLMPRLVFLAAAIVSAQVWAFLLLTAGDAAGQAAGFLLGRLGS
jgi:membrane protein DedA with SNARE-associated domain